MVKFLWVGRLILEFLAFPIWTDLLSIFAKAYRYSYYVFGEPSGIYGPAGVVSQGPTDEKNQKKVLSSRLTK